MDFVVPDVTLPALPCIPLWATRHYLHACQNCSVPMKPTKSKKSILALIVIIQMVIRSQELSSRLRAPPLVYLGANGIRDRRTWGKVD